jgi:hypothetical protein
MCNSKKEGIEPKLLQKKKLALTTVRFHVANKQNRDTRPNDMKELFQCLSACWMFCFFLFMSFQFFISKMGYCFLGFKLSVW